MTYLVSRLSGLANIYSVEKIADRNNEQGWINICMSMAVVVLDRVPSCTKTVITFPCDYKELFNNVCSFSLAVVGITIKNR